MHRTEAREVVKPCRRSTGGSAAEPNRASPLTFLSEDIDKDGGVVRSVRSRYSQRGIHLRRSHGHAEAMGSGISCAGKRSSTTLSGTSLPRSRGKTLRGKHETRGRICQDADGEYRAFAI